MLGAANQMANKGVSCSSAFSDGSFFDCRFRLSDPNAIAARAFGPTQSRLPLVQMIFHIVLRKVVRRPGHIE
jgi:hypothetical protein